MIEAAIFLIFPACLAFAAAMDLLTMTIPNRVSIILVCAFLPLTLFFGLTLPEIAVHFAGAAIVFSVCFALFSFNVMGGGDAKLLAAAALWFGFNQSLLLFVIYVAYVGGLVTILILMLRSRAQMIIDLGVPLPHSLLHAKKIPYGIAIAIGGLLAYPSSPLMTAGLAHLH
jgi:prepilin peptidase CpaA